MCARYLPHAEVYERKKNNPHTLLRSYATALFYVFELISVPTQESLFFLGRLKSANT